jgi:hypothetical protein
VFDRAERCANKRIFADSIGAGGRGLKKRPDKIACAVGLRGIHFVPEPFGSGTSFYDNNFIFNII